MVKTLSARLNSDVELGELQLRLFPRLRVEGSSLTIRKRGLPDVPPLISIQNFHVDANILGLMRKHVEHVAVEGLTIQIPPGNHNDNDDQDKSDHERQPGTVHETATAGGDPEKLHAKAARGQKPRPASASFEEGVVIDTLDAPDAKLVIVPREKNRPPKVWAIHTLTMHDV